ncbi:SGNH/GDSL hydrolase family protein [Allonocardiopsis opalescens]|uniref:SGNH/GDSL hydrolase family protein n=1 Tax=Allonocardiopsis opalescens TaxID=1144618 RepID=UPI000D05D7C5|nr:SGNH/GDSL hydrolase family protein [Allonocardiopsis opalescens]
MGTLTYVAIGDSFTEGLGDPYPDDSPLAGRERGWADRVAEALAAEHGGIRYANLAVRGRLIRRIVEEQVPQAVALAPDLVTFNGGGNDLIRPGADPDAVAVVFADAVRRLRATGATVAIFTGQDTAAQPAMRHLRGKIAIYNAHLRAIADRYGAVVVDMWPMRVLGDPRAWCEDRLHLSPEGHRRVALRTRAALGLPVDANWADPWPSAPRPDWRELRRQDARWLRHHLLPWIGRRLSGRSSGDGRTGKRPEPGPV